MDHFGMASPDAVPMQNAESLLTSEDLLREARNFVDQYCEVNIPDLDSHAPRNLQLQCTYCNKQYIQAKSLRTHEATVHGHADPMYDNQPEEQETTENGPEIGVDHIKEYTKSLITIGLARLEHEDAIKMGDGDRLIRINSLMLLIYKTREVGSANARAPKYAYALMQLMMQVKALLPPQLAYQLAWNRTVNYRGKADTNFPVDKDVEHCNKFFKGELVYLMLSTIMILMLCPLMSNDCSLTMYCYHFFYTLHMKIY